MNAWIKQFSGFRGSKHCINDRNETQIRTRHGRDRHDQKIKVINAITLQILCVSTAERTLQEVLIPAWACEHSRGVPVLHSVVGSTSDVAVERTTHSDAETELRGVG
jgi:hypothetical protein